MKFESPCWWLALQLNDEGLMQKRLPSVFARSYSQYIFVALCASMTVCSFAQLAAEGENGETELLSRARSGDRIAQNQLASKYLPCEGGPPDKHAEGLMWLKKAAASGLKAAQLHLGINYRHGHDGVQKDERKAHEWFLRAAGEPVGQWEKFLNTVGLGPEPDEDLHAQSHAQNNVGSNYRRARGVERNYEEAVRWYQLASAGPDNATANKNLGLCYANGWGVEKNEKKAFEHFLKASEGGEQRSDYHLAVCYLQGRGVSQDQAKGLALLERAAQAGDHAALARLAKAYQGSIPIAGVGIDKSKALELYERAYQKAWFNLKQFDSD